MQQRWFSELTGRTHFAMVAGTLASPSCSKRRVSTRGKLYVGCFSRSQLPLAPLQLALEAATAAHPSQVQPAEHAWGGEM